MYDIDTQCKIHNVRYTYTKELAQEIDLLELIWLIYLNLFKSSTKAVNCSSTKDLNCSRDGLSLFLAWAAREKKNEKKIERENIRGENETKCVTRPSGSTASPKKTNAKKKKYVMEKKRD